MVWSLELISSLWLPKTLLLQQFLSPLSAVPLVSHVGFGLYELGFPGVSTYLNCLGSKLIY
ncbi:hypothetical protein GLYMA_15G221132v4 [Glycine max]|nr:hypothetical protein GLYMA_15G221132v4 [Glycine max]